MQALFGHIEVTSRFWYVWRLIDGWTTRHYRLMTIAGTVVCAAAAFYWVADDLTFSQQDVRGELNRREDIYFLFTASSTAHWTDIPRWFAGPWNYPGVNYYRPVTSVLFFLEFRLFGDHFSAYNRISALLHGGCAALLFLVVCSLYRHWPRGRIPLGLIAVYWFGSPAATFGFAIHKCVRWWPAQNDILSLMFALAAILCFDHWLLKDRRWALALSILFTVLSIGSKEMGFMVGPILALLALYRKRFVSAGVASVLALTIGMWLFRSAVLPHAWSEELFAPGIPRKLLIALAAPYYWPVAAGNHWQVGAVIIFVGVLALARTRRIPPMLLLIVGILCFPLCAQLIGPDPNVAKIIIPQEVYIWVAMFTYISGLCLFVKYRAEHPGLFAVGAFALANLPILQYFGGQHYHYWPASFMAIADAIYIACVLEWGMEVWRVRSQKPTVESVARQVEDKVAAHA